jgi:cyclic pyranopterin phosphate synthase
MTNIKDRYGRTFKTLRISLLNRCNLACIYCTSDEETESSHSREEAMGVPDLLRMIENLHRELQFETIRLTGGEPLLYEHLMPVIKGVKAIGLHDIKLTTNGFLLERMALQMKEAGMQSINVSLDAMDEDVFFLMSKRNNVARIIRGIEVAVKAGLHVKINTVLMKGINDSQILPLLEYAFPRNIPIRFLELMAMGHVHHDYRKYLFKQQDILETISARYKFSPLIRSTSSTANYWQTDQGNLFGIIANESAPFCQDCNRLRLDTNGNIYGCLSSNHPVSLLGISRQEELNEKLHKALSQKQPLKFVGSELSMLDIGG